LCRDWHCAACNSLLFQPVFPSKQIQANLNGLSNLEDVPDCKYYD